MVEESCKMCKINISLNGLCSNYKVVEGKVEDVIC
jgi:hypothetical protein